MKLQEALPALRAACEKPFGELFADQPQDLWTNKGNVGQLLELLIDLSLDNRLNDFEDGELKTNKAKADGKPMETMFITQISTIIDTLVGPKPTDFSESNLYKKIRNLVYVPVVKEQNKDARHWYFKKVVHIQMPVGSPLYKKMEAEYYEIAAGLKAHIDGPDGFIHTTNGARYLQIRSKDSKPYHPIHSAHYGRYVSNKNHAFYFRKEFMIDALDGKF